MVITDPGLRHPHSVAFSSETNHLVVTNAAANYFSVYAPEAATEVYDTGLRPRNPVVFNPTVQLVLTGAGVSYASVCESVGRVVDMRWSPLPLTQGGVSYPSSTAQI